MEEILKGILGEVNSEDKQLHKEVAKMAEELHKKTLEIYNRGDESIDLIVLLNDRTTHTVHFGKIGEMDTIIDSLVEMISRVEDEKQDRNRMEMYTIFLNVVLNAANYDIRKLIGLKEALKFILTSRGRLPDNTADEDE